MKKNKETSNINDRLERAKEKSIKAMDYAMKRYTERAEKRSQELIKAFKELEKNEG